MTNESSSDTNVNTTVDHKLAPDIDPLLSTLVLMVKDGKQDPVEIWFLVDGIFLEGRLVPSDQDTTRKFFGIRSPGPTKPEPEEKLEDWQIIHKQSYCFLSNVKVIGGIDPVHIVITRVRLASVSAWGLGPSYQSG